MRPTNYLRAALLASALALPALAIAPMGGAVAQQSQTGDQKQSGDLSPGKQMQETGQQQQERAQDQMQETGQQQEEKAAEEKPAKKEAKAKPDDLTKIEGIGPKAAEALTANGVGTYAELADADAEKVKEILTEASSTLAHLDPTSWPKQAKMAAEGKWDELKEWQDSVKGGVE